MEPHNVYHHHHYHHHYHYNYPFPPGLPPNVPQSNDPLNQEVAGHGNDEQWAEDEEEENGEEYEEERSERDDTEDQQNPEGRSPTPVQEGYEVSEFEKSGFVVFDDSFGILNLDALSPDAQARFTAAQSNDDHQDGPPRKKARTSGCAERPKSQGASQHDSVNPQQSGNITIIDKARIISTDGHFCVVNCDPAGPQLNIRWRVPGQRNVWLFRIPFSCMGPSFGRILDLLRPDAPGDMPLFHTYAATADKETVSLIVGSCGKYNHNRFERGGGVAVPPGPGDVFALGRLMGFEVLQG